MSRYSWKKA